MDMLHLLLESRGFNIEHHTTVKNYMMDITSKPGFFILLHQPLHCQVFLHQLSGCTGVKASEGSRAKGAESEWDGACVCSIVQVRLEATGVVSGLCRQVRASV